MSTNNAPTDQALQALLHLDQGHPYRAVADGSYRPKQADDDQAWAAARGFMCQVLAADVAGPNFRTESAIHRRSALGTYLCWLAADDPRLLTIELALGNAEIGRYLATEGIQRRSSHRSRVAMRSMLRSFRACFPDVFAASRISQPGPDPVLAPVEDWQFDIAYEQCDGFRTPATRFHARNLLLLSRGAGLDGADLRWVRGDDVEHRTGAGIWVVVKRPGHERSIPVLARFGKRLEDLAHQRLKRVLISDVAAPCASDAASQLAAVLVRHLKRNGNDFAISPDRLRKAWLAEHVGANCPLNTLLAAAGLSSLRSLEDVVTKWGPPPPPVDAHLAYELGGITRQSKTGDNDPDSKQGEQ
jgi:hypothetical protein